MNRKELVASVSEKFSVKPGRASKIVDHVLEELMNSGLSGEGFNSPILSVKSKDVPQAEIETPDGLKTVPAKKIIRLIPSKKFVASLSTDAG